MSKRRFVGAILTVVSLVIGACSGGNSPTPTPVATGPTSTSIPSEGPADTTATPPASPPTIRQEAGWGDVLGPVLVYQRSTTPPSIVAYDIGRKRAIWSALSQSGEGTVSEAAVVSDGVVVTTQTAAYLQRFDGSALTPLFGLKPGWERIYWVDASPDGTKLAFSISRPSLAVGTPLPSGAQGIQRVGSVFFYDLTARREIREVSGRDPAWLSEGPLEWREDGQGVFLHSLTNSEGPGPRVTVLLDGRVIEHDLVGWSYLAPDGHRVVHGIGSPGCMAIGGPDVYVRDLDTGVDSVEFHDSQRLFAGLAWSPDGKEFLLQSRPNVPNPDCNFLSLPPPALLTLNASTGTTAAVPDMEALYNRWYGDELLWIDCQGRFVPIAVGIQAFPYAYCLDAASRSSVQGTLRYQDLEIDFSHYFRIYGIIP